MATKRVGTVFVELNLDPSRYMRAQQTMVKESKSGAKVLEKNFKNLGIKSNATFDLMRNQAIQSFEAIRRSGKATANDLVRAEKAKAEKIKRINREQYGEQHKLLNKLKSNWKSYALVSVAAITSAVYATKKLIESVAETGDQFHKMSLRTGVAVEQLSALGYAAQISGTDIKTVEKSLRYASKVMVDYERGIGLAKRTFEELGLTVIDSTGKMKGTVPFLIEVSDKIKGMADETKKAAFVSEIFGAKAGTQLLPLLKLGSQGIEELMEKAKALGDVMSTSEAAIAAEYTDTMRDLTGALGGVKRTIGVELMPALIEVAQRTTDWVVENQKLIDQKVHQSIDKMAVSVRSVVDIYNSLPEGLVGATAYGVFGRILFGGSAGRLIFALKMLEPYFEKLPRLAQDFGVALGGGIPKSGWEKLERMRGMFQGGSPGEMSGAGGGFGSPLKLTIGRPGQIPARGETASTQRMTSDALRLKTLTGQQIMALEQLQAELLAEQMMANDTERLEDKSHLEKYMAGQLYNDLERMGWEHQQTMKQQAAQEKATRMDVLRAYQQAAGGVANTFMQIAQAGGKQSKQAFVMYKAFAITEAGIGTALAITKTLGQLGAWGVPVAIAIGAMGAAQIAMIAASQPPSYDQGGISRAQGIYQTGNIDEAHIPLKSGKVPVSIASKGGNTNNIQYIDMTGSTFLDQDMMTETMNNIAAVNVQKYASQVVINDYNNDSPIRSIIRGRR